MTKIMFDVNKSLAECPPEIYYSQLGVDGKPLFPGIHHKKRIVLNRSLVTFRDEDQIRELDAGEDRVDVVQWSYKNVGFLYNKIPQAIIVDPNDPNRLIGVVVEMKHKKILVGKPQFMMLSNMINLLTSKHLRSIQMMI